MILREINPSLYPGEVFENISICVYDFIPECRGKIKKLTFEDNHSEYYLEKRKVCHLLNEDDYLFYTKGYQPSYDLFISTRLTKYHEYVDDISVKFPNGHLEKIGILRGSQYKTNTRRLRDYNTVVSRLNTGGFV